MPPCRIVTLNIFKHLGRWDERRGLLAAGLRETQADVIMLQEVNLRKRNGDWLLDELNQEGEPYTMHICPNGPKAQEGLALLSRWPMHDIAVLDLQTDFCMAMRAVVHVRGQRWLVCNGHYYWWPTDTHARLEQVQLVMDWLAAAPPHIPQITGGDFNAAPHTSSIRLMTSRYLSAYVAHHGHEPHYTCPNLMVAGLMARAHNPLVRTVVHQSLATVRRTVDYIFVQPHIRVSDCRLILNHPAPYDPTLYASDHFGIQADVEV